MKYTQVMEDHICGLATLSDDTEIVWKLVQIRGWTLMIILRKYKRPSKSYGVDVCCWTWCCSTWAAKRCLGTSEHQPESTVLKSAGIRQSTSRMERWHHSDPVQGKGSHTVCGNYRPISLMISGKVFALIPVGRMQLLLTRHRHLEQSGVTVRQSTMDTVLTL